MTLPSPVLAYIDADGRNDGVALIDAFAPDAAVKDEGRTHVGQKAIGAWWRAAKAKYQHVIEPLESTKDGRTTRVLVNVTGQFTGSPARMVFAFRVEDSRIAGLEINP
ncbi:nuclear transport factor 2 family protein [Azospirillum sp. Sh1]|uniref:nuclear transport factor 2 family protein n=1 Tax=Azospirillum sp. Sh1 TaxID=2607285 RepID=UPI0011EECD06|nr:nuclear transport factor 2 family protein [Azospirillum sp. Sh1]KAA0574721.1 nuclear transport factor 2 family protein [Azospirillum sp. Sh1]